ncbi:MAG: PAS domain S-box protein [Nitrospirota bacterium]
MSKKKIPYKQPVPDDSCRINPFEEWGLTFDAIPDHLVLIDLDMRLTRVNKAFAQQLGKRPEDLVGEPCYRHICRSEGPKDNCPHLRTIKDGKTCSIDLHLEHLGGDFQITTSSLRDRTGKICGSVHLARDITERKKAEDALRQSETRFRSLVEQSLVGIYILRDGKFIYVNPKLAEIFGYSSPEEIVFEKSTLELIAPESRALVAENDRKRLAGEEKSLHYTFKGLRKDGRLIDIEAFGNSTEIDGRPAIIGTLLDVTGKLQLEKRQRDMETRLHQQQRQQSIATLAGGVAHDFNNMLMGVLGSAEILKEKLPPDSKEREFTATIIDTSRRMAGLTRQLLDYARQGSYEHNKVALNHIVQDTLAMARWETKTGIQISQSLADDLWPVIADCGQLGQVIINLISNAAESMEGTGGRIEVRTENVPGKASWECPLSQHPAGDYVHLSVSDTGPGIPRDMQKKIFEPFYTTKFMGRGLGLASSLGVIQNHGGCLSVASEREKGATFHMYLPRYADTDVEDRKMVGTSTLGSVLVVDDEPHVLTLLKTMLTELGYRPLIARNAHDALLTVKEQNDGILLAILDVQLTGPGGADLFSTLKKLRPGLKVLISSGYDESTALSGFREDRPDGFIQKPYWIESLRDKLLEVLQGGSMP